MKKTIVKFLLIFVVWAMILSPFFYQLQVISTALNAAGMNSLPLGLLFFAIYSLFAAAYFIVYYYNKRAFVFSITDNAVRIQKSWIFGTYEREITLDQIRDVQVSQGILARFFNCGSLMFVTASGLEVGYAHAGVAAGIGLGGILVGGGSASSTPHLLKGRGNTFWDIPNPSSLRQALVAKLSEWRGVVQEQKMATSLKNMTERAPPPPQFTTPTSLVNDIEKLNALMEKGAITRAEYQKAKEKLLRVEN